PMFPLTIGVTNRIVKIDHLAKGTGFFVDFESRQFLLTAAHVVKGCFPGENILLHASTNSGTVTIARKHELGDAAVLVLKQRFKLTNEIAFGISFYMGQDVYLAGFPDGKGVKLVIGADEGKGKKATSFRPYLRGGIISNGGNTDSEFIVDSIV